MLVMAFIQWWYGPGWRDAASRLSVRIHETYLNFSMPALVRTLFAPWRRITSPAGASLQDKSKAILDNAISRAVGFVMRSVTLLTGCVLIMLYVVIGGLLLVLWPAIPLLGPSFIVWGIL